MGNLRWGQTIKEWIDDENVIIQGTCYQTHKPYEITVNYYDLKWWLNGEMKIQDALPQLPPEQREFLQSGISPEGFDQLAPSRKISNFTL